MANPRGFMELPRQKNTERPPTERLANFREFTEPWDLKPLREQASRCMDCGIPFCHSGCPLGNLIPDWNTQVSENNLAQAWDLLHSTNNFPEFTGRVCPAPCESSCVLNLEQVPVSIKAIEVSIADRGAASGWLRPQPAVAQSGKSVAIVGSGPAGLAAAQQLARKGHSVVVYEKDDKAGGLLRYGIPDFKLDKHLLDRRLEQLRQEGVVFKTGVHCGVEVSAEELSSRFDALLLCTGAPKPRDLPLPGRNLEGIHFAMDYLTQSNRRVSGEAIPGAAAIDARGKRVVVLGGGDTGSDCVGTALRQGAASVTTLELMPRPPTSRTEENPWPEWPLILRSSSSHEEGGSRQFASMTVSFSGHNGRVQAVEHLEAKRQTGGFVAVPGTEHSTPADLVLLALGFVGPEKQGLVEQLGLALDSRGNLASRGGASSRPGVFVAGDAARGQSLVVWAIAEGRKAAEAIERYFCLGPQAPTQRNEVK